MSKSSLRAALLLVGASLVFGSQGSFLRSLEWAPLFLVWFRFVTIATGVILVDRKEIGLPRTRLGWILAIGFVLSYAAFPIACTMIPVVQIMIIFFSFPVISLVMTAITYRRWPTTLDTFCVLVGFTAVLFTAYPRLQSGNALGSLLTFFAAVVWAGSGVIFRLNHGREGRSAVVFTSQSMGALLLMPFAIVELQTGRQAIPSLGAMAMFFGVGIAVAAAFIWYSDALRVIQPDRAAAFMNVQVPFAALAGWVVNSEPPHWVDWVGATAIVGANVLLFLGHRVSPANPGEHQ